MKQQKFESLFQDDWKTFKKFLDIQEIPFQKRADKSKLAQKDFPKQYRKLCHHLALAKERKYSFYLVEQLNSLVLRGHQHLYIERKNKLLTVIKFFIVEFPALVRKEWRLISLALSLFYLSGILMMLLTFMYPELIHSVFSQQQINQFEDMYDPEKRVLGRTRESDTDLYMFGYYIAHNIGISFQVFASGIALGLGSIFYLIYNGVVLGAVSAHLGVAGFSATFFPFVIGHGSFELTAIVIAGAAGLKIGFSMIAPGRLRRIDALKVSAKVSIKLVFGVIVMLVIAAFLEAFWSSGSYFSNSVKYGVGAGLWIIVIAYLFLSGRNNES